MADALHGRLVALLRDELDVGSGVISRSTALGADLLLDSLATVELVMVIEDALDIGLTDTAVADLVTVGDLVDAIVMRLEARESRTLFDA